MTTRAIGEEDYGQSQPQQQISLGGVMGLPPERRVTTMAEGEEDGSGMGVSMEGRNRTLSGITTQAVGEEGESRPPQSFSSRC